MMLSNLPGNEYQDVFHDDDGPAAKTPSSECSDLSKKWYRKAEHRLEPKGFVYSWYSFNNSNNCELINIVTQITGSNIFVTKTGTNMANFVMRPRIP